MEREQVKKEKAEKIDEKLRKVGKELIKRPMKWLS